MKIDRLLGIITLLLQNEKMTAPALAARFEVSRRTIGRDMEALCKAGVPIVTVQGANGGVSILDSFKIDKTLFTARDLKAILAGLASLDSIAYDRKYQNIMDKFAAGEGAAEGRHLRIDLSSHYKNTLAPKIETLTACIDAHTCVSFDYFNKKGERQVVLEPALIVFQWSSWYALGYDCAAAAFRLFKLNRMENLRQTDRRFTPREVPAEKRDFSGYFTDALHAVILFDKGEKYRLVEEYGLDSFTETAEGALRFSFPFTDPDYLVQWVLSFGDRAELLEPRALRPVLSARLQGALKKYAE